MSRARLLIALVLVVAAAVPGAFAAKAIDITPDYIAGAHLGWKQPQYRAALGPLTIDRLELGYTRLTARSGVQVYLRGGKGVAIATWSKHLVDQYGITPCASVSALEAAYGSRLKPALFNSKLAGYRSGPLLFATEGSGRIKAIMLAGLPKYDFIAYNSRECTTP